jgi:predicted DNA-binding protein with PD1-like motif
MQYSVGTTGKVIVARLETGEPIYSSVEGLAKKENIRCAVVWIIGSMSHGGVVVGPRNEDEIPLQVLTERFDDARELLATGTLFPNAGGSPKLHMHAAIGKGRNALVGCPREGADCWLVDEVVIMELIDVNAKRLKDAKTGLELLTIGR